MRSIGVNVNLFEASHLPLLHILYMALIIAAIRCVCCRTDGTFVQYTTELFIPDGSVAASGLFAVPSGQTFVTSAGTLYSLRNGCSLVINISKSPSSFRYNFSQRLLSLVTVSEHELQKVGSPSSNPDCITTINRTWKCCITGANIYKMFTLEYNTTPTSCTERKPISPAGGHYDLHVSAAIGAADVMPVTSLLMTHQIELDESHHTGALNLRSEAPLWTISMDVNHTQLNLTSVLHPPMEQSEFSLLALCFDGDWPRQNPVFFAPDWMFGYAQRHIGYTLARYMEGKVCDTKPLGYYTSFNGNNDDQFSVTRYRTIGTQWNSCSSDRVELLVSSDPQTGLRMLDSMLLSSCQGVGSMVIRASVNIADRRLLQRLSPLLAMQYAEATALWASIPASSLHSLFAAFVIIVSSDDESVSNVSVSVTPMRRCCVTVSPLGIEQQSGAACTDSVDDSPALALLVPSAFVQSRLPAFSSRRFEFRLPLEVEDGSAAASLRISGQCAFAVAAEGFPATESTAINVTILVESVVERPAGRSCVSPTAQAYLPHVDETGVSIIRDEEYWTAPPTTTEVDGTATLPPESTFTLATDISSTTTEEPQATRIEFDIGSKTFMQGNAVEPPKLTTTAVLPQASTSHWTVAAVLSVALTAVSCGLIVLSCVCRRGGANSNAVPANSNVELPGSLGRRPLQPSFREEHQHSGIPRSSVVASRIPESNSRHFDSVLDVVSEASVESTGEVASLHVIDPHHSHFR